MATEKPSQRDIAYAALRERIQKGAVRPGEVLTQADQAEQLGLSRMPVREAMQRLEYDGLLTPLARRGWVVKTITTQEIEELYVIRTRLETLAAARAATRVEPGQLEALRSALDRQRTAVGQGDELSNLRALDRAFHREIWNLSRSPLLESLLDRLVDAGILDPLQQRVFAHAESLTQSIADHEKIYQAIASGDAAAAEAAMAAHAEAYWAAAIKFLSDGGR